MSSSSPSLASSRKSRTFSEVAQLKRVAQPVEQNRKPTKRARVQVRVNETTQVANLSDYRLPLADADVYYVEDFLDREVAQAWHDELLTIEGWYQPTLKMYGKEITQSRKIAAFATDPALTVKYSGTLVDMKYEYPPLLRTIQDMVETKLGVTFNHCMLNSYQDGTVYIGNHRDNRENRVIASVSLGAARTFILEHDRPPPDAPASSKKPVRKVRTVKSQEDQLEKQPEQDDTLLYYKKLTLENGSLIVMQGDTQLSWKHQIPKEAKVKESRISLTFRQLVF